MPPEIQQPFRGSRLAIPLGKRDLVIAALVVWTCGAAYCHGYDRLRTGLNEWPGSLLWSATAVLPWLALLEVSKTRRFSRLSTSWNFLLGALVITASISLALEELVSALTSSPMSALGLEIMRRAPAAGTSLLAILWAASVRRSLAEDAISDCPIGALQAIASSIDWIAAADNYIELHIGDHVSLRRQTIQAAEAQLRRFGMVRIHRRFLVNRRRVRTITGPAGKRSVVLESGAQLPMGRRYAANLQHES
jgi:hypothetical protein